MSMAVPSKRRLSVPSRLFYGFGSVAFGVKDNGFSYFLLIFYNQVMGLPAATVGTAIMAALVIDAFLDPIVGQLSDNWKSGWGRRHPFMYASALPVAISYLLLWNPPHGWSDPALFLYLLVVAVLVRSFITLYEIPSSALTPELSSDYDERTRLLSYRYLFGWVGGLTMYFSALTFFLKPGQGQAAGQLNPAGYSQYGTAAAGLMFFAILVSSLGTHRQIPSLPKAPERPIGLRLFIREMLGTLAHRSFLVLLVASIFNSMALGLGFSINLYFQTFFWELPAAQIALFAFSSLASALFAFFAAPRISERYGKKRSAMVLITVGLAIVVAPIVLRLLGFFPANGSPVLFPTLFVQNSIGTGFAIAGQILFASMIADVVEDSEVRTGRRQEGLFFAATAFVAKAVTGLGIFVSSLLLSSVGFPEGARPGQVSDEVVRNLGLAFVPTLGALYGLAVVIVSGYRISRESHEASLRQLRGDADEG